jgi:hypothetical protein
MSSVGIATKTSYDSAMPRMRIAQIAPLYERIPAEALRRHRAQRLVHHRGTGTPRS